MSADPTAKWNAQTRFLECDARSLDVLRWLARGGWSNALVLAREERLDGLRAEAGALATKLAPWCGERQALGNNADVLWLSGEASAVLWRRRSLRHVRQIVVAPNSRLRFPLLARRMAGMIAPGGTLKLEGGARFAVYDVATERPPRARYFLSPELGLLPFFAELERRGVRWMVLRWPEQIPDDVRGDVDLLIHDDDAPAFLDALGARVGTIPLDVYAVHGSHRMAFRGACYYPSEIALGMLARSRLDERGVRVAERDDAFFSLAFHALYHKGPASGLATSTAGVRPTREPKHDFATLLGARARELGLAFEPTMEALDELIAKHGWRPPRDTLRKWSHKNRWIRERWFRESTQREPPGWCVFVVRRAAIDLGLVDELEAEVVRHGFRVLAREPLTGDAAERFRRHARGGNWGRDEFAALGGPPALFLIAFDPEPKRLRGRYSRRYPDMDNGRIVAKREMRDALNERLPEGPRANFLHTSDNSDEAWEYIRIAFPERVEALRRELEAQLSR